MKRVLRQLELAVLCVLLAVVPVIVIIFWSPVSQQLDIIKRRIFRPRVVASVRTSSPPPPVADNLPPGPQRKGNKTWKAVEASFDQLRAGRAEYPEWRDDLSSAYDAVANPAFTDSADLVDHCVALGEWRREIPTAPTPLVALARTHIGWAWQARGNGPAAGVSEEQWQLFYTRIAEARRLLDQALKIGVKDGEAHRLLILVGMAEGRRNEEVRATLDEGRRIDPTYFPLYVQFARYLLPRWHGQRGDVERFAAEVVKWLPGDDGLEAYARIALKIHQIDVERELLFFGEYDKPLLVKSAEVLMQRRNGAAVETNFAALCAWVAQDRQAALRLRPGIDDSNENDSVWPSVQQRRDFRFWCDREFTPTNETRWLRCLGFCGQSNSLFYKVREGPFHGSSEAGKAG